MSPTDICVPFPGAVLVWGCRIFSFFIPFFAGGGGNKVYIDTVEGRWKDVPKDMEYVHFYPSFSLPFFCILKMFYCVFLARLLPVSRWRTEKHICSTCVWCMSIIVSVGMFGEWSKYSGNWLKQKINRISYVLENLIFRDWTTLCLISSLWWKKLKYLQPLRREYRIYTKFKKILVQSSLFSLFLEWGKRKNNVLFFYLPIVLLACFEICRILKFKSSITRESDITTKTAFYIPHPASPHTTNFSSERKIKIKDPPSNTDGPSD